MKLLRLHLQAFGPFTDRVLDFGTAAEGLVLVHGPNEAGKSSTLRAISDLRFGIPQQSKDNFVHAHPDLRLGGIFVDRQGREYSLMRRKGRGATLHFADFDRGGLMSEAAVPPEVEALLTCGLTKEEYESMFGLDYRRLREGGEALLKGEGEVGAALFEASAGVRSIPRILERLDQSARKFFMPGARGKNACINEALNAYDEHHAAYRHALIRPSHWAELYKKHRLAAEEVGALEARRIELNGTQLLIKELRAVAPLLGMLDHASQTLGDLQAFTLLSANAAIERAAAESGLATARHSANVAVAEAERQRRVLAELALDTAVLEVGRAIKRLTASVESIDRHRTELADATSEVTTETARVANLVARIDVSAAVDEVLAGAPAPATKAGIERLLRGVERAQQGLEQHLAVLRQAPEPAELVAAVLPSAESRTALRIAQGELARSDTSLKRLAALPGEIRAARRAVTTALNAVGMADEGALRRVQPMLDAQIDEAINSQRRNATRREEYEKRIDAVSTALATEVEARDHLLDQGSVPTADDVRQARSRRDSGWMLVRGTYIDGTSPPTYAFTGGKPLPEVYEGAVADADRLSDELAADSDRAAQLQSSLRGIAGLQRDRDALKRELDELDRQEEQQRVAWSETLAAAQLPSLSPTALRDWQALLSPARNACETLQARLDELEQLQRAEQALAEQLRGAIVGTAMALPAFDTPLSTLAATAAEVEEEIKQREKSINTALGKQHERDHQRQQMALRETQLKDALQSAVESLKPVLAELRLAQDASVEVARARLGEFDELVAAEDRLATAEAKQNRACHALSALVNATHAIAKTLGEEEPIDARLYIERLSTRLESAEQVQALRALAQNALDTALESQRNHEETVARHEGQLARLCEAAGVESGALLPEAEEQSRRKREAQSDFDRASRQLAQASRRAVDELRTLLADQDNARMDSEEAAVMQELAELEAKLRAAREGEEMARRALEAIDSTDVAAAAREAMERDAARVRANMSPWIRSRIAHALLAEALKRFRDRAQAPMLKSASGYFERMTAGEFVRLISDDSGDHPILIAQRQNGLRLRVEGMSEGTRDQLYLALRLAALELRLAAGVDLPVIFDDVLMTSDDRRAGLMLHALADFARQTQVIVFTHHRHLIDIASSNVPANSLAVVSV